MSPKLNVRRPAAFTQFHKAAINQGIHERIEERARLHPDSLAISTQDGPLTYAQLNSAANCIAEAIRSTAGDRLAQVVVLQPHTAEFVISVLACLKAGKAYVPFDPAFPPERLRAMQENADPVLLLADEARLELAGDLARGRFPVLNTAEIERHADAPNPRLACDPGQRAYILYTSGSTGRPKGIAFLHRNLLHTTMCLTNALYFSPTDRVTWLHSGAFAASVVDLYCCLTNGAGLCPWDVKARGFVGLSDWLVNERVTTLQWIPSAFRHFLRTAPEGFVYDGLRLVVLASEPLTIREVNLFKKYFPTDATLINQVGTSESYNYRVYAIRHDSRLEGGSVPGGYQVCEDREVLILDDAGRRTPLGAVGEIAVKSRYMSAGYWRDEVLTAAKFAPIDDNIPVYRTGDLGKLEPDGCLIHLGRKDFQVKVRGYRVELAEVEEALTSVPGIADSLAWVVQDQLGEDRLVGYVILAEKSKFDQRAVESALQSRLPDYMVPRHYVVLSALPTLPTGKIDRGALPNPFQHRQEVSADSSGGVNEHDTIALFQELLQIRDVNAESNFLDCGGDSLLAAVLLQKVHHVSGTEISLERFLESPTPGALAGLISEISGNGSGGDRLSALPDMRLPWRRARSAPIAIDFARSGAAASSETERSAPKRTSLLNLVIIGAGQFGREVFTWASQAIATGLPFRIKGFLDDRPDALNGYNYNVKILGNVDSYTISEGDVFVIAIGNPVSKVRSSTRIIENGGLFVNIIHPLANIGHNVRLGTGIVLAPFSSVTSDITIGDHVSIGAFSNVGHDVVIGDWCQISSHCGLNGASSLGDGVFVGSHACMLPRVRVASWAHVGAGSVVVRNVESYTRVFGNPAAPIGKVGGPQVCEGVEARHA
jgi:sugar O-acyltransferase (sialic acid O-acetyltransferase NeuD family)